MNRMWGEPPALVDESSISDPPGRQGMGEMQRWLWKMEKMNSVAGPGEEWKIK